MKVTLDIDDDIIRDAVGSANIDYWTRQARWSNRAELKLRLVETEPDKGSDGVCCLSREDFERALVILATKYPHHFKDLIARTGDMYTGDILIQCAAFGEEKYV